MSMKKGMAGLILLVLVIGYMMAVSTSSTMMIQTESSGKFARRGYKNAYYAAVAGIGATMAHLRSNAATTFDVNPDNRPYFTENDPDTAAHSCNWSSDRTYGGSNHTAPGWINCGTTFTENTEVDVNNYLTLICTYPAADPYTGADMYYMKSQGKYIDSLDGREFYAQVWAKFSINTDVKIPQLVEFGTMGVQSTTYSNNPGTVDDFWDWQNNFQ